VLRAPPTRLYRAFLEPDAIVRWLPPYGFTCTVHALDAHVGGRFRMAFTNLCTGGSHTFGGENLELVPNERIRHTDVFDAPDLPGTIEVTVVLKPQSCATEPRIEQANIPVPIPLEMCHLGWQESLEQLARLVEPEIPGRACPPWRSHRCSPTCSSACPTSTARSRSTSR
jgi:uncharacterized protein YndB with AHSA1/START domain